MSDDEKAARVELALHAEGSWWRRRSTGKYMRIDTVFKFRVDAPEYYNCSEYRQFWKRSTQPGFTDCYHLEADKLLREFERCEQPAEYEE